MKEEVLEKLGDMDAQQMCMTRLEVTRIIKDDQWDNIHEIVCLPTDLESTLHYMLPRHDPDESEEEAALLLQTHIEMGPFVSKELYMEQAHMYLELLRLSKEIKLYSHRNESKPHIRQMEMFVSVLNCMGYGIYRGWPSLCWETWDILCYAETTRGNFYSNF